MLIDKRFIKDAFENLKIVGIYNKDADKAGLWASEKYFLKKYLKLKSDILDIGCGCGRASFGMIGLGYGNITGIDISEEMIGCARRAAEGKTGINFIVGDACSMPFDDSSFNGALFTFNGLMHIPGCDARLQALREVYRVLREYGIFIFVTQVREDPEFEEFWKAEKKLWDSGLQDPRLAEFGDVVFTRKGREIFLHIPSTGEVKNSLTDVGFNLIEVKSKSSICKETAKTGKYDSMFWIAGKGCIRAGY